MPFDNVISSNREVLNFTSAIDLTANRYRAVRIYASYTVSQVSATSNPIIGIQENTPLSGTGRAVRVCTNGVTLAVASGAFTAGAMLTIDANGQLSAANTSTQIRVAIAIDSAAAASEVVSVLVRPDNSIFPA